MSKDSKEIKQERHSFVLRWPIVWKFTDVYDSKQGRSVNKLEIKQYEPVYRKSRLASVSSNITNDEAKKASKKPKRNETMLSLGTRAMNTPCFRMCGCEWSVILSPVICDADEYLSVHLRNVSQTEVFAKYSIRLKSHTGSDDIIFEDPEGVVCFSSADFGNNEWGCDDFVLVDDLECVDSLFTLGSQLKFELTIETQRDKSIKYAHISPEYPEDTTGIGATDSSLPVMSLTTNMQNVSLEQDQLMELAKEDISSVLKKLSKGRDVDVQKLQEDRIVKNRLHRK